MKKLVLALSAVFFVACGSGDKGLQVDETELKKLKASCESSGGVYDPSKRTLEPTHWGNQKETIYICSKSNPQRSDAQKGEYVNICKKLSPYHLTYDRDSGAVQICSQHNPDEYID